MQTRPVLAIKAAMAILLSAPSVSASEVSDAINVLLQIGPEGQGHESAMAAWKTLAAANIDQLTTLLGGIKEDTPLGNNWMRSAIETVVQRSLQQGNELPVADLEEFLMQRAGDPQARRLAYELIARVDSGAEQRLIPKMLNDPSVELRRDAVAKVLDAAKEQLESDKQVAKATYRKALTAARDQDQIDEATKQLDELGEKVDLTRHFGFLLDWKLIGPFDNTSKGGFDAAYPPEEEVDLNASHKGKESEVRWISHSSDDAYGVVNLNEAVGKHMGAVGYAYTEFVSERNQPIDLRLTSKNGNKVWLNGQLLMDNHVYHSGSKLDQYVCRGKLKRGKNTILLKICQNEQTESWAQDWQFQLRVCDKVGTAILAADRN